MSLFAEPEIQAFASIAKQVQTARSAGCNTVLLNACRNWGVTRNHMGALLGLSQADQIYKYLSGRHSLSPLLAIRLARLWEEVATEGLEPVLIRRIDWNNNLVYWRDGRVTRGDQILEPGRDIPPPEGHSAVRNAPTSLERERPPVTYSPGNRRDRRIPKKPAKSV